jgi:hypothetical protein
MEKFWVFIFYFLVKNQEKEKVLCNSSKNPENKYIYFVEFYLEKIQFIVIT